MARKKSSPSLPDASSHPLFDSIIKDYGDGVIVNGTSIVEKPKAVISVGPVLDAALGGGFQEGGFVLLTGLPRCGKTTVALSAASHAQQPKYNFLMPDGTERERRVVYENAEARLESRDLRGIPGLDTDKVCVIQSHTGKILTMEDHLTIAEKFLMQEVGCFVIMDSISIMCSDDEMTAGLNPQLRGRHNQIMSSFLRRMAPVISVNRHIVIGIVHLYSNTSGRGPKWMERASNSAQYGLTTKLRSTYFKFLKPGGVETDTEEGGGPPAYGQKTEWLVERSPLGPPGEKVMSYLRYGRGIDEIEELVRFGIDLGIVEKSGSWYDFDGEKAQGLEAMWQRMSETPDLLSRLREQIYGGMGVAA